MAKIIGTSKLAGLRGTEDRMIVPDQDQDWNVAKAAAAPARADAQGPAGPQEFGSADSSGRNVVLLSTLTLPDGFIVQGDAAFNHAGDAVSSAGDINNDGFDDFLVAAPVILNFTGEVYLIYGKASGYANIDITNLAPADGFVIRGDTTNDQFGFDVSAAGDVNNDGFDDIIIGAQGGSNGGSNAGEAYVIFGKSTAYGTADGAGRNVFDVTAITLADGFIIQGDTPSDQLGRVSSAGDINNDGYDDVIAGAAGGDDGGNGAGEAYVIFGKASGFANIDLTTLAAADGFIIQGDTDNDSLGRSVSRAGDLNGDGYDDIIIGASGGDNGGSNAGEAYVIFGKASGFGTADGAGRMVIDLTGLAAADGFIIQGDSASDFAGVDVSSAGDINNDGYDDLVVGATGGDDGGSAAGEAYVIFGKASGLANIDLTTLAPTDGFIIQGDVSNDQSGRSVAAAGDVNGDGFDDIIVGQRTSIGALFSGGAAVIFGGNTGFGYIDATGRNVVDLTNLANSQGFIIQGSGMSQEAGSSVSAAGDINNDGYDDLIVGAPGGDNGGNDAGQAYIIFGKAYATNPNVPSEGADLLTGTSGDDVINALGGNDRIDGLAGNDEIDGGAGADTMIGRTGDDIYYVDNSGDVVVEAAGEGNDTIRTTVSLTLGAGIEIEHLAVRDAASTNAVSIVGNEFSQTITGNAGNNTLWSGGGTDTLTGLGGDDMYALFDADDTIVEAAGGGFDQLVGTPDNYVLAVGVEIEVILAHGNVTGNAFGQQIFAIASNVAETFDGGGGIDSYYGKGGDDKYLVRTGDSIFENAGEGNDEAIAYNSFVLNGFAYVEKLSAADNGVALNLTGNGIVLQIVGNSAANTLDAAGAAATLTGLGGNDTYVVDQSATVVEAVGGGTADQILAKSDYTIGAGVDVEILSAYSFSTIENFTLIGNGLNNQIFGNAGNNFLSGGGGADALYGNAGNDTYSVDNDDSVVEGASGGFDIVYTSANYGLSAGAEIEVLSGNDGNATTPLNLAGNEFGQAIFGNAGDNFLIAGAGADALYGGLGNDTYSVDTLDVVFDSGGNDIIYSSTNFTLTAGSEIEILSANDFAATTALNLAGNEYGQQIFGNAGNNFLIAGAGADGLYGMGGNDTYSVDSLDVVVENAGEGYDTVYTSTSFTLAAGTEVEVLSASDFASTNGILLTGNGTGQQIFGNSGGNTIDGKGGADTLIGGAGADLFTFTTALGGGNVDSLADFQGGFDKIGLDHNIFTGLAGGSLSASAFVTGSAAGDADDRIVYNSATGALLFDADGNGAGAAVQFASVAGGLNLTANDFIVI